MMMSQFIVTEVLQGWDYNRFNHVETIWLVKSVARLTSNNYKSACWKLVDHLMAVLTNQIHALAWSNPL